MNSNDKTLIAAQQQHTGDSCCCLAMCEITEPISSDSLMAAAENGDLHYLRHALCVSREKIMEFADEDGLTALHVASRRGHLPIVKFLLNSGELFSGESAQVATATVDEYKRARPDGSANSDFPSRVSTAASVSPPGSTRLNSPETPDGTGRNRQPDDFEKSTSSSTTCSSDTPQLPASMGITARDPKTGKTDPLLKDATASQTSFTTQQESVQSGTTAATLATDQTLNPQNASQTQPISIDTTVITTRSLVSPWADKKSSIGHTALHWAALKGHETCVAELLEHGFDVNALSQQDATPLQLAVAAQKVEVVQCLLKYGADASKQTLSGSHPSKVSTYFGNLSLFDALKGRPNAPLTYFP